MLIYMPIWPPCSVWVKLSVKNRTLDNGTYHESRIHDRYDGNASICSPLKLRLKQT